MSNRASIHTLLSGILQQDFHHPQTLRKFQAHPGPISPQQIPEKHQVHYELHSGHQQGMRTSKRALVLTPQRGVLPHPYTQGGQEVGHTQSIGGGTYINTKCVHSTPTDHHGPSPS